MPPGPGDDEPDPGPTPRPVPPAPPPSPPPPPDADGSESTEPGAEESGGGDEPDGPPPPAPAPPFAPPAPAGPGAGTGGGPTLPTPPGGLGSGTGGRGRTAGYKGLERWEYWWEFNKDRFLKRKPAGVASGPLGRAERVDPMNESRRRLLIPALERAAADQSDVVRAGSMMALGKLGGLTDFAVLYRGVRDDSPLVRRAALLGLAYLGTPDVAPILMTSMADVREDSQVRAFAAAGLGLLGNEGAVPFLAEILADAGESLDVRGAAALGLSLLPGDEARMHLLDMLGRTREPQELRALAATAIGRHGDFSAVPPLLRALRDKSVDVRRSAALALGAVRYRSAAQDALEAALASHREWAAADALSESARRAMEETIADLTARAEREASRIKSIERGAVRALLHSAEKDSDQQVQAFSLVSLGEIGSSEAHPLIGRILGMKSHRLQAWAGVAAGVSGETSFVPYLLAAYRRKGADPSVRGAMAIALGLLRDRSSAEELAETALDPGADPDLRGYAVLSLGMMWDPRANDVLDRILRTKGNPSLHRSAAIVLGLTGRSDSGARLVHLMEETNDLFVKASVTIALGYLRDRTVAEALAKEAADPSKPHLARLFSVLSVGYLGDRDGAPPRLSRLAWFTNYRIAIPSVSVLTSLL